MKNILTTLAIAIAAMGSAQAQSTPSQTRFFLGAGLTYGGDKLASAEYEKGGKVDIRAGSLVALNGGIDFRINPELSLQASFGYHVDDAVASNGDMRFARYPVELLAYYNVSPEWRIGAGARSAGNAKLRSDGAADFGDYDLDNSTGVIVEAEYMVSPQLGIKMRAVSEKYRFEGSRENIKGNHVGVLANWYF